MPESVRWSVVHRRYKQAETVLRTAARFNGVDLPEVLFRDDCKNGATPTTTGGDVAQPVRAVSSRIDGLQVSTATEIEPDAKSVGLSDTACERRRYTAVDMFRTPRLRQRALIFAYIW